MPGGKKQNALTLTFSKKNMDIHKFFEDMKQSNENFVATEYICEAIRFYWEHKGTNKTIDEDYVKRIVDERLAELSLANILSGNTYNATTERAMAAAQAPDPVVEEKPLERDLLESDINGIDIDGE